MADCYLFSIYFHHGGKFIHIGDTELYYGGQITRRHKLDVDRFGFLDLEEEVQKLGYVSWDSLRWKVPNTNEYKFIHDDKEVIDFTSYIYKGYDHILVYVDNGKGLAVGEITKQTNSEGDAIVQEIFVNSTEIDGDLTKDDLDYISDEDNDYFPESESETDDEMDGEELVSDDEEYIEVRNNKAKKPSYVVEEKSTEANSIQDLIIASDYADSSGKENSEISENEDALAERGIKHGKIHYDPKCDHKTLKLVLGMIFENAAQCKHAIQSNALEHGYPIHFTRSSQKQVEAHCIPQCGWRCYGSLVKSDRSFVIKMLSIRHTCPRDMHNKQATSEWIANEYLETFRARPDLKIKELQSLIMKRFACEVSRWRLYRAKWKALNKLRGSLTEHYAKLRDYVGELIRVDPEGRFELQLGEKGIFKSLYIGLSSLKKGFLAGCRRVIGLDGCFLKTILGGVLLTAIGKDGNNQMFPIAWAVVEVENENCWSWFLKILFEELGVVDGLGLTLISDQQKGLINVVSELVPHAEHRNCARHIYCNWKKTYKGPTLKNMFWNAVKCTYPEAYNRSMENMKAEDEAAYLNFLDREPRKFCKAFISTFPRCDMIDNNISETFNGFILNARGKPLIDMLEEIRNQMMVRQYAKLDKLSAVSDRLCPTIKTKIESLKFNSRHCTCIPALGGKFEVHLHEDAFVVNIGNKSCTCRSWDLTGIPCIHACSAISFLKKEVSDYVDEAYTIGRYIEAYRFGIEPTNGPNLWKVQLGDPVLPPLIRKMPGRPKKKRIRAVEENEDRTKLSRFGLRMTCRRCMQDGHNKRTCKNDPVIKPPEINVKKGRPRKDNQNVNVQNTNAKKKVSNPSTSRKQSLKEKRLVKKGFGVMVFEDTGNIYTRMPNDKQVRQVSSFSELGSRSTMARCGQGKKDDGATQERHA